MFEQITEPERPEEQRRTDWSGTIIGAALLPVFVVFVSLGRAELGFSFVLVLGMVVLAVRLQWKLRKHVWFWGTIAFVLALHIPLLFLIHWPSTKTPTIAYSLPFGIVDFLLISGAVRLSERLFLENSSVGSDEQ